MFLNSFENDMLKVYNCSFNCDTKYFVFDFIKFNNYEE